MLDALKKNSLLIVDDDTATIMELVHMFEPEYTIYTAKNGADALENAKKVLPDLILLDILMPEMNGFDVLGKLKDHESTKAIPVIFITGLNEDSNESEGLAIGAVDYIRKPFDATIVKRRIRNQIQFINLQHDLEQAVKASEIANRTKSAFLANMSHEIRTPMNAILGVTEIMIQNEKLPEEIEAGLEKIYSSCDLLLGIINDILDFSKIEAGKLDIMPATYKVASMINDSVHLNMMRIDSKPIEFELQIDEDIPAKLFGDELRIKQILNNFLSNAFKYTDMGKVTLSVSFEPMPDKNKVMLKLSVRDTGHGMTEEQLSKVFDEYLRFHQKVGKGVEGTGLGLAIAQNLITLMSGEVSVESEVDKGSLFTVRLPQEKVDDEIIGKEVAANLKSFRLNYMHNKRKGQIVRDPMPYGKVLVVDDMESNLYVAVGLMKFYRLQIETAKSGTETIEKIKNGDVYDVIFMDHMMPETDGIEVTRQLRDLGYKEPIVALTANAVAGQADIFLQNGFDDFISKPIDIRQLNSVLNKFVRDKQSVEVIQAARNQGDSMQRNRESVSRPNLQLLESFVRDAKKTITLIDGLCKNDGLEKEENLRKFIIITHGIKSSLGNIAETKLSAAAYELEIGAREKDFVFVRSQTPEFLNKLRALSEKIEPKLNECGVDDDLECLRSKLQTICEMCADYDRKGILDMLVNIKNCSKETKTFLDNIKEYVIHSDFEEAQSAAARYAADI